MNVFEIKFQIYKNRFGFSPTSRKKLCSNPPAAAIPKMYTLNNIAYKTADIVETNENGTVFDKKIYCDGIVINDYEQFFISVILLIMELI